MPLIYKPFQSELPTKDGERLFYPRLVKIRRAVDTDELAEMIAEKSSLTPGDVHSVVRNLMSVMRSKLLNGRSVRLNGLGTFTIIARAGGQGVKTAEEVSSAQIKGLRCRFTPEYKRSSGSNKTTRSLLDGVEYVKLSDLLNDNYIVEKNSGKANDAG